MELEEQEHRETGERQKEGMSRDIAAATGQSAHMLRASNRVAYNAPSGSLTDERRDSVDMLAQNIVYNVVAEQSRRPRGRICIVAKIM